MQLHAPIAFMQMAGLDHGFARPWRVLISIFMCSFGANPVVRSWRKMEILHLPRHIVVQFAHTQSASAVFSCREKSDSGIIRALTIRIECCSNMQNSYGLLGYLHTAPTCFFTAPRVRIASPWQGIER